MTSTKVESNSLGTGDWGLGTSSRGTRPWALGTLLFLGLVLSSCTDDLSPTGAVAVHLEKGAAWPDTLAVAEVASLTVSVTGPNQQAVTGLALQWASTDSSVVTVTGATAAPGASASEQLAASLRAIVTSHRSGEATIVARVAQTGFAPVELRAPVVVRSRGADSLLTVGDVDTVGLTLQRADSSFLSGAKVTWGSSDPSVVSVAALAADSTRAVITGRISGTAQITATVQNQSGRSEFQLPVVVLPLEIVELPSWSPLITFNDTATFAVKVQDGLGRIKTGVRVEWRSTNEAAFSVDSNGTVLGKSRGGGELVATVGAAPFQVAEHRATLQVVEKWRTVSAGFDHTCAIAALDGTGYCWGSNNAGELGTGLTAGVLPLSSRPLAVATSHRFNELQAGDAHTCGEEAQVNLFCWGSRSRGAVGDGQCAQANGSCGAFTASEIPVTIISDGNLDTTQLRIEQLLVGGTFTCILGRARFGFINRVRRLRCWGTYDIYDGSTLAFDSTAASAVPLEPSPFADQTNDYVEAAAGGNHVCAKPTTLYLNFRVLCMGMNFNGELGYGPLDAQTWNPIYQHPAGFTLPVGYSDTSGVAIGEGIPVSGLATGSSHTCALDGAGGVLCWGNNSSGQLGSTGPPSGHGWPTRAAVPVTLVSLAAGGAHTCGLTGAGAAYCWGSNSNGQLGNGTIGGMNIAAAPVSGGITFVSLSAGGAHTCGVTPNGAIYCWGGNASGQLGDGTQTDRGAPVRVGEAP
jgi:alpha-tubulin suppressor-like RCC1 family protein